MKIITNCLKALTILLLFGSSFMKGQTCAANFIFSNSPNGVVTFTSTSALTNSVTTFYWNFGNSTTYSATGVNGMAAMTTYSVNGNYVVTLFIMSTAPSCSSAIQYTVSVNNASGCALTTNFNYTQGSNGLVNFNNTTGGTNSGTTYSWNFGDASSPSTSQSPSHTYAANGPYTVTLVATNNSTCVATKTLVVNVNSYCTVIANFNTTAVGNNGQINFVSTSTGTFSGYTHQWAYGDGGTFNGPPTAFHNYVNGTYTATLTVMNNSVNPTCVDTITKVITVTNNTCNVVSNFAQTVGSNGSVSFNSTSTSTTSTSTYTWYFGNGQTSNSSNPTVSYASGGVYYVYLTVSNGSGCQSSSGHSVNVNTQPCVANANFSLAPTNTPQYWYAIPAYPYNVASAQWSWGDNSVSTGSIYSAHQYSAAGLYTICLTVTATCGSTAQACASYSVFKSSQSQSIIYINVTAPPEENIDNSIPTGINEFNNNSQLSVFPNPSTGAFMLRMNGLSEGTSSIKITNLLGSTVFENKTESIDGQISENISLPNIASGIYLINVRSADKNFTQKIVIEK